MSLSDLIPREPPPRPVLTPLPRPTWFQEKRVDKATLEMEPEYPARYFDDLATDLCTREIELRVNSPPLILKRDSDDI